jgi:hypothetical protein
VDDPLTDEERSTLKTAAFGAVFLISNADPGLLSMLTESFAASDAIAATPGLVGEILADGRPPRLPSTSPADVEAVVLPALRRSVEILRAKAPGELDSYRSAVVTATGDVARASGDVSELEAAMMTKVRTALGVPG